MRPPARAPPARWITEGKGAEFCDPEFLKELFVDRTDFLANCDGEQLTVICQRWGEDTFAEVWDHCLLVHSLHGQKVPA